MENPNHEWRWFIYPIKNYTLEVYQLAPENWPSQKESSLPTINFQGRAVKLRVLGGFSSLSCDAFRGEIFAHLHWHPSLVPLSIWEERSQGISFVGWFTNVWNMNHGNQCDFFVSFVGKYYGTLKYSLILFIFGGCRGGWKNAFKMSSKSTWCPCPFPFYHSLKFGLNLDPWCQSLPGFWFTSLGPGIPGRTFICHCY